MSPSPQLQRIQALYRRLGPDHHPRDGFPDELRDLIGRFTRQQRADGQTWRQIAKQLPVSSTTAHRWMLQTEPAALVPVVVTGEPKPEIGASPGPLVITSPTGFRLSGITIEQAAQLLGHLQ